MAQITWINATILLFLLAPLTLQSVNITAYRCPGSLDSSCNLTLTFNNRTPSSTLGYKYYARLWDNREW